MSMQRPQHDFGPVDWISAEAIGVPGQRTFRLLVSGGGNYAHIWLEKEQLQALADAVARMGMEIDAASGKELRPESTAAAPPKPAGFPASPDIDFHVLKLTLSYDPRRNVMALEAQESEEDEERGPFFRCLATRDQMEALRNTSLEVISAGRPRCPLCGTPLSSPGMPHFCPPTNGHQKLTEDE